MGRRFCPRGWIRGAKEGGGGEGFVGYGHLGTKTLGRNYHYTAYSRRERHEMVLLAERACFLL